MKHVKQIEALVAQEQIAEAYEALDSLLCLGPKNTEALKLRAHLLEHEGRFDAAEQVWVRLAEIDPEDEEIVDVFVRRHFEDREHFFFTDDLPTGERRFIAYPRRVISTSAFGLIGSLIFLLGTRLTDGMTELTRPPVIVAAFAVLVILPWIAIIVAYFRSMRFVAVGKETIEVATRWRLHRYRWADLTSVHLTYPKEYSSHELALILVPNDEKLPVIEIDLSQDTTGVRARSHFLREILKVFQNIQHTYRSSLSFTNRRIIRI